MESYLDFGIRVRLEALTLQKRYIVIPRGCGKTWALHWAIRYLGKPVTRTEGEKRDAYHSQFDKFKIREADLEAYLKESIMIPIYI